MEDIIEKTPWTYVVYVSKDSPRNIYRGWLDGHRGYSHPVVYTDEKEAAEALAYFEKGHIEKRRHTLVY
jgi:hypothetical protein